MHYSFNFLFLGLLNAGPEFKVEFVDFHAGLVSLFVATFEGTQPGFHFPNSRDPPGTPTDLKKKPFISFKPF